MGPRTTSENGFGGCFAVGGDPFFRVGRRSGDFLIFDKCMKRFACFCFGNLSSLGIKPTLLEQSS